MAMFNGRLNIQSYELIDIGKFNLVANLSDNFGIFYATDATIGNIIYIDASGFGLGILRYKVIDIDSVKTDFGLLYCTIQWDLSTEPVKPISGTDCFIGYNGPGGTTIPSYAAQSFTEGFISLVINMEADIIARQEAALKASASRDIDAESTARQAADAVLQSNIDAETIARQTADTTLTSGLAAEVTARTSAIVSVQAAINAEVTARQTAITNLINGAPKALDTLKEIADMIEAGSTEATVIIASVTAETTNRQAADAVLQSNIDAEVTARKAAIDTEVTTRAAADSALQTALDAEVTARQDAIIALQATARAAADALLQAAINAEATARTSADAVLQSNIDAEVIARKVADAAFTGSLGVERTSNDFHIKLAANSKLTTTVDGLAIDSSVMAIDRMKFREPANGNCDGINTIFTLGSTPVEDTEHVFVNGILNEPGVDNDYTISGATITFNTAPSSTSRVRVSYVSVV
jgi:predicted transcriptional regulator